MLPPWRDIIRNILSACAYRSTAGCVSSRLKHLICASALWADQLCWPVVTCWVEACVPTWFTGGCQLLSLCVGLFIRMNETWQELHCYLDLSLWWCIVLWHGLYLCEEDGQVASHLALEDFGINRSLCSTQWSPKSKSLHRCARQLVWGVCADMLLCVIATLVSFGCRRFGKSKLVFFVEKQLSPGESCKLACLVFSNYHVTNLRTVSI